MELNVSELMDKVFSQMEREVKTETIVGEEFTMGKYTVRPIMKVGLGFGGGGGEGESDKNGKGQGGGAGAGFGIAPVGFLVTKGDEIQMIPAGASKGLSAMFEKLPDVLEKAVDKKFGSDGSAGKKKKEEKTPE